MREFVYGTDEQYEMLKNSLRDNMCHVYRCELPSSCSVRNCRIGFEYSASIGGYICYIDKHITCSYRGNSRFNEWLQSGEYRFLDFNDIKTFLKSLRSLY